MIHKPLKTVSLGFGAAMVTSVSFALIQPQLGEPPAGLTQAVERNLTEISQDLVSQSRLAVERVIDHEIQPGQTLSEIFQLYSLNLKDLGQLLNTPEAKAFHRIKAGKRLQFTIAESGVLRELSYLKNALEKLVAVRDQQGFTCQWQRALITMTPVTAKAVIHHSLFADGQQAGIPRRVLAQLADIFAYDIDFAHELQPGDAFKLVYEQGQADGHDVYPGRILAAEFKAQGKTYQAVYFADKSGQGAYYRPDGRSLRTAFLRSPVEFARISSHFNLHRKHPVLNKIRAHKGVDYAAPTGTPIKTTAEGKIAFQGWKGGYGRCVIVQHGEHYSTLYGHLSRFQRNLHVGKAVKQGQVIGYIGQSGLATGPHLHYEFRVDGVHKNPLTVALPNAPAITRSQWASFQQQAQSQLQQLEAVQIAQN
ncbi:MAG: peptidoglycan DD-metalloendopeptidase family protein [Methylococcales bacterium]|nr:peptidoglycan DD-metalloendopeptidase family protein [Methylococcales bacterium]